MDQLSPPEVLSLDGNIAESWRRWKQRFNIFSLASGLSRKDAKVQAASFLHVAGLEALEVYNTFTWDDADDKNKVDKIIERFDQYLIASNRCTRFSPTQVVRPSILGTSWSMTSKTTG